MNNLISFTPTTPMPGGQDIEDLMPVDYESLLDEGVTSCEHGHFQKLNPFTGYPRGPGSFDPFRHRRRHAVFADAVESRTLAANDAVASTAAKHRRAVSRVQSRTGDCDDEGGAR